MDDDDELEAAISAAHHLGVVVDSVVRLTSVVNTVAAAGELLYLIKLCARASQRMLRQLLLKLAAAAWKPC